MLDLSRDGKLILGLEVRKVECPAGLHSCTRDFLVVYDAATGRKLGERTGPEQWNFGAAGFTDGHQVSAVTLQSRQTWIRWDPAAGTVGETRFPEEDLWPVCPLDGDRFLVVLDHKPDPAHALIEFADTAGLHGLRQPAVANMGLNRFPLFLRANCRAWRSGRFFLIPGDGPDPTLDWVSTDPAELYRTCRSFPGERVHGYAISPDGTLVAVVTGAGKIPVGGPDYRTYLNVLAAGDCSVLRRFPLAFPEKAKWRPGPILNRKAGFLDNIAFADLFARQLAISPDNRMLAVAYGIMRDPNGFAYFGLYSLADGHRISTLAGDAYRCGIWHGALLNDELHCQTAPFDGAVLFSPDSQKLFGTSKVLHRFNVSGLK